MNRLLTGAVAALTLIGGTAALGSAAQAQSWGDRHGGYSQHRDYGRYDRDGRGDYRRGDRGHHRYSRGQYAPRHWRGRDRYVDYRRHHLRHPPRGYGWVRGDSGEYLMIMLATGLIASIANGY